MGNFETIVDSLPFRASVDWSEIAIFAGDMEVEYKERGHLCVYVYSIHLCRHISSHT
jgi:hypothetical protein